MTRGGLQDFIVYSRDIAKDFLHSVVVIDEEATFSQDVSFTSPTKLKKPGKVGDFKEKTDHKINREPSGHSLNAKQIIDAYASNGIFCSIIKPERKDPDLFKIIETCSKQSDLIILDWMFYGDAGEQALEIIKNIVESEKKEKSRLRLFFIYTAEKSILKISDQIKEYMCKLLEIDSELDSGDIFTFCYKCWRISVYAKDYVPLPNDYSERALTFEELTKKSIDEFAQITSGILSNVVLSSISAIRNNTYALMAKLSTKMDPPYLSHRALLSHPDDAKQHALDIISSELRAIIDNDEIDKNLNHNIIKAWLEMNAEKIKNFMIYIEKKDEKITTEDLVDIEKVGFENSKYLNAYIQKKYGKKREDKKENKKTSISNNIYKNLTKTFCNDGEDFTNLDCEFAILTSMKSKYDFSKNNPSLTLGTLLKECHNKETDPDSYWLCIQPKCECVRIKEYRKFLFLLLTKIDGEKLFDFVIKDNNKYIKLRVNYKAYESRLFEFEGNKKRQMIISEKDTEENYYYFRSVHYTYFNWMSELSNEHAQRIANKFASNISRVGLDESEWLRRSASK